MADKTQKIEELLNRGTEEIINRKHLERRLMAGEKLRVKFGIDPTSADLHLGHSIPLRKLRQFQELGHQVIFLIGDYTARIGDPSGRLDTRKSLSETEVKQNMRDYTKQAGKILDMGKVEIRYNSEWYDKKDALFFMDLTSRFTYARLIERDEFEKRIKHNIDVTMLELLYPLLQGYDSVALKADVEIGGTDQKFNLGFGRKVQKKYNVPEQDIITLPLLVGTDGVRKMSKSIGNCIKFTEEPVKMFGQIMSISDTLIWHYFELLTDIPLKEIEIMRKDLVSHRKDMKMKLAGEIVKMYHGQPAAKTASTEFDRVFKEKKMPQEIAKVAIKEKGLPILDLLVKTRLAASKSEAKRLVAQGGVKIDSKLIADWREKIVIRKGAIIQVGKRKFTQID